MVPSGAPYFMAEFSTGPSLFARIKAGFFPIQFGRYRRERERVNEVANFSVFCLSFSLERFWPLH